MKKSTEINNKKRAMLKALEQTLGVVTAACLAVGIDRTTHYLWLKKDEKYRKSVESIDDIAIDFVESKLHGNIKNGDVASIIFFLKKRKKKRGYTERQEVDMNANLKGSIPIDEWIKCYTN
jgi:hypothetical protein